jgi:hypothetical protein
LEAELHLAFASEKKVHVAWQSRAPSSTVVAGLLDVSPVTFVVAAGWKSLELVVVLSKEQQEALVPLVVVETVAEEASAEWEEPFASVEMVVVHCLSCEMEQS